jgi:hypothetical protein
MRLAPPSIVSGTCHTGGERTLVEVVVELVLEVVLGSVVVVVVVGGTPLGLRAQVAVPP